MAKIYAKEQLEQLRLVDTTPRGFIHHEKAAFRCHLCENTGEIQFSTGVHKMKHKGYAFKCKQCLSKENSDRGKQRTGDKNSFYGKKHTDESKDKIKQTRPDAIKKSIETNLERYGTYFPSQNQEVKDKQAATCQERYDSKSFLSSESGKESLQKGIDSAWDKETRSKRKSTILDKYGFDSFSKTQEFRDKMKNSKIKTRKYILSTGEYLVELCQTHNKNISNAIRVLKRYGESVLMEYLRNEIRDSNNLEKFVMEMGIDGIERFNKKIGDLPYRPDFRVNDFYINSDGLYWHSERDDNQDHKDYHFKMREVFCANSIRIMQFREDEILYKTKIVKSIIENACGISKMIGARDCSFQQITPYDSKVFFSENHLMGNRNAIAYGLYHKKELVACMSVIRKKEYMEIARFANKNGYSVIGGFSKLLKNIEKIHNPPVVLSYCDLRYATGSSYEKNGFKLEGIEIGFSWTDTKVTFNRLQCRANMDERKLTESEYAKELGWYKIYDAGQAKYIKYR